MPEASPATSPAAAPASAAQAPPIRAGLTWVELRSMPLWLGLHFVPFWLVWHFKSYGFLYAEYIILLVPAMLAFWAVMLFLKRHDYVTYLLPLVIVFGILTYAMLFFSKVLPAVHDILSQYVIGSLSGITPAVVFFLFPSLVCWSILIIIRKFIPIRADASSLFCMCSLAPLLSCVVFFLALYLTRA